MMYNLPPPPTLNDNNHHNNIQYLIRNPTSTWTKTEDKLFEKALVDYPDDVADRWHKIAVVLPGKTPYDVRTHYEALVHDVLEIDSGRVELPTYADDPFPGWEDPPPASTTSQISFASSGKGKHVDGERKKGNPWTEDEHRYRFLLEIPSFSVADCLFFLG